MVLVRDIDATKNDLEVKLANLKSRAISSGTTSEIYKQNDNLINWFSKKIELIDYANTGLYNIPLSFLPKKIHNSQIAFLKSNCSNFDTYYKPSRYQTDPHHYLDRSASINNNDVHSIATYTSLSPRRVVNVHFGYNIGIEFGGDHLALILRNFGESLLVIPLSSKSPSNPSSQKHVQIIKKYGFTNNKDTWANVGKIQMISIHRVDFNTKPCEVHKDEIQKISTQFNNCGFYNF